MSQKFAHTAPLQNTLVNQYKPVGIAALTAASLCKNMVPGAKPASAKTAIVKTAK